MGEKLFPEYSITHISNIMNLRIPQKRSLEILDSIVSDLVFPINQETLHEQERKIHNSYPVFNSFEHGFLSLTFAIATGVGKTRLMGAFITYLYTQKGIKNFFVVAPSLTIYEKLKNDLGNPSQDNEKYVFRGVECFAHNQPNIWKDDDYRTRPIRSLIDNDSINIYIFNISKFNSSEERNRMLRPNEYIGDSFTNYLKSLEDLVVIMDESHHYRAEQSAQAIDALKPMLGIELTATPHVERNGRTEYFKNVVYQYPLSMAIADGYTRTPYALTRRDLQAYQLNNENLDIAMINDGIAHHEHVKNELIKYAVNNNVKCIKPFALIVCKDTRHAEWVHTYICSDQFRNGYYKDKTIIVHSNQRGTEKDENIQLLLDVEKPDNNVEIVIHVNKLKEGWDVNNLYTIIPLRTATSRTLREQTIGRGLRLPYGVRTGEKFVDSVAITAHDRFEEIINESQDPTSIFKADKIIYAEDEEPKKVVNTQLSLPSIDQKQEEILYKAGYNENELSDHIKDLEDAKRLLRMGVENTTIQNQGMKVTKKDVKEAFSRGDLGSIYESNTNVQRIIDAMFNYDDDIIENIQKCEMYIPQIKTETVGNESYIIQDFILDYTNIDFPPIRNEILYRNLINSNEEAFTTEATTITEGRTINPIDFLIGELRDIPEIDYEKCSDVLYSIVNQYVRHLNEKFNSNKSDVNNVCLLHKNAIIAEMKTQLLQNLLIQYDGLVDTVESIKTIVLDELIDYTGDVQNLYFEPQCEIKSIVYDGANKSATNYFKFDSNPERIFAVVCENSPEVLKWLRPSPKQFNITYNRGRKYIPDFVVETNDCYYLVEVKSTRELNQPDVLAKKERGIQYCSVASEYNIANGHKPFKYLFIPHDQIHYDSSFNALMDQYVT